MRCPAPRAADGTGGSATAGYPWRAGAAPSAAGGLVRAPVPGSGCRSRRKPLDGPFLVHTPEPDAIVQPPFPALPELHLPRREQVAAPVRRRRDVLAGEPGRRFGGEPVQFRAGGDRLRLRRGPGPDLRLPRPAGEV